MKKIERIYRLDGLLELANFDIGDSKESDFLTLIRNYCNVLDDITDEFPFVVPSERFNLYMEGLPAFEDTGVLEERRKYFMAMQRHFISRLYIQKPLAHDDSPVQGNDEFKSIKPIELKGSLSLKIHDAGDKYVEQFVPTKTISNIKLNSL